MSAPPCLETPVRPPPVAAPNPALVFFANNPEFPPPSRPLSPGGPVETKKIL